MRAQAQEQNISDLLPEYDDSSFGRKVRFFDLFVKKVWERGGIVFLDEFQNIEQLGLETYFMGMIGDLESNSNGKLVVAGSHQQGLIKMSTAIAALPIETVCIVRKLPGGWDNKNYKRRDEKFLWPYKIRIISYDKLIENADLAYGKFLQALTSTGELRELIDNIRKHDPTSAS